MRQLTRLADRMLGVFVPRVAASAACPSCGAVGTSCGEIQYQTCSVVGGGTGLRSRRRTCYWGANCYKSCTTWGPWSLCSVQ